MKRLPTATEEEFALLRNEFAEAGFKLFTAAWSICRMKHHFIAVSIDKKYRGFILVRLTKKNRLEYVFYTIEYHGEKFLRDINKRLGISIKCRGRLPYRDWQETYTLVTPHQHEEFKTQIYNTQLS
jgi:hypothetical protein